MPNLKIMNHIVLDAHTSLRSLKVNRGLYRYTEEGMLLYPIENVIPIIIRGNGCVGVGVVKSLHMERDITTIEFEVSEVDKSTAKVLYSMYRNNATVTASSNEDIFNSSDVVIPGVATAPVKNLAENLSSSKSTMDEIMRTISGGNGRRNPSFHDDDDFFR